MKDFEIPVTFAAVPGWVRACAFCVCAIGLVVPMRSGIAAPPATGQEAAAAAQAAPAGSADPQPGVARFAEWPEVPSTPTSSGTHCSLDVVDGEPARAAMVIDHRVPVTFVGWAGDDRDGVPARIVFLLIGKKTYGVAGTTGLPRKDVTEAMHNPAFALSGFSVSGDPAAIPQGEYHPALIERFGTSDRLCLISRTIAVK